MSDNRCSGPTAGLADPNDEAADLRLGRYAIGLLEAARETGDPALIALAETMAMAAGFALAVPPRETDGAGES